MTATLPPACDGDIVSDESFHSRTFKDKEHCAMDVALPPACDGDVDADNTFHSQVMKDDERCEMDAPLPPYNGDDDADKTARSRTTRARAFLAIGLAVEVCATLWAFYQAVLSGVLDEDLDCNQDGRLPKLYASAVAVDNCAVQIDIDVFYNYVDTLTDDLNISMTTDGSYSEPSYWEEYVAYREEYVGCDSLNATAQDDLKKRCGCSYYYEEVGFPSCSWVALLHPADGICYAQVVFTNSSDGGITWMFPPEYICWALNPPGTVALTVTALVVALSSQLLEAFVGFKYWTDTATRTVPTLAASIFDALGVFAVSTVLLTLPGQYSTSEDTPTRLPAFFWLAWTVVAVVIVGALAEITAECSDRAAGRLPYLGAVGNGLIWLGAAMLEMVVTTYIIYTGVRVTAIPVLVLEAAVLFALEVLGLVSMWIARGLWTRAKLSRPVKSLEGALRKRAFTRNSIDGMLAIERTLRTDVVMSTGSCLVSEVAAGLSAGP